MWEPDPRTLFLILFLVNAALTLMLFPFWKTQKTYNGFQTWMLSLLVISCGYFLYMLRGSISDLLSVVIANALIVLSVLMRIDAVRKYFWSKPIPGAVYAILIPFTVLFLYYTYLEDSVLARALIMDIVIVPGILVTALLAIQFQKKESRLLRLAFVGTIIVVASLMTVRIIFWLVTPGNHSIFSTDTPNSIFFVVTILTDILATGFFLMLNMARSQADLRASEERYRDLTDNLPDYVVVHDGGVIRYANTAAARLVGLAPYSLSGESIYKFLAPASAEATRISLKAAAGGESGPVPGEIDIQLRDGTVRHCIVKTARINFHGSPAFLSVITDITDRKSAELALSRVNKKLSILSSITRHDIKNQLLALTSYLSLSKESPGDSPASSGYLEKCFGVVGTIVRQIDFTRIYEDMGTTAPVWQNIESSVRHAVTALPAGDTKVVVDRPDLELLVDPLAEKVFYNLIDNALRYGGNRMTTVRFSARETDAGLSLTCEDDGEGIGREDKEHLFEQGFGKNTGLGLFLSREILSITGISIAETSEPGKGARFEMVVPRDAYRFAGTK
jgi:PAS domain S-box-containing protein